MLLIVSIVLFYFGAMILLGRIKVFENRKAEIYFGFGLLVLAVGAIVLMVKFPHG